MRPHCTRALELTGSPPALGDGQGAILTTSITAYALPFIRGSGRTFRTPYESIRGNLAVLEGYIPNEYRQEMQALAHAAGTSYVDVLALNTFLDTGVCCAVQAASHCINIACFGRAVGGGPLLHGRNLDFPTGGLAPKFATVCLYQPEKGYAFLAVSWAGFIGVLTGMNQHGLTIAEITAPTRKVTLKGVPLTLLLRMVLERAGSIAEAVEVIRSTPRTGGFNITLTDARTPEAVCVEFDAEQVAVRKAERGVLVSSENCLTAALARGQRPWPSGVARHIRACDLVERHYGRLTPELMIGILQDKWDPIRRRQGDSYNCICNANTVQSVVFVPEERRALVSNRHLPAPEGEFVEYRLEGAAGS